MSTGTTLIGVHDVQCWVPQSIMEVKTIFLKDKSHLFWTLFPRHFVFFLFIVCKISCKHFVSVYYCELGFDLDRKSANFGFIISARYELAFSFNYEFVMIFLWNYNILIMVINFIKLYGTGHWSQWTLVNTTQYQVPYQQSRSPSPPP